MASNVSRSFAHSWHSTGRMVWPAAAQDSVLSLAARARLALHTIRQEALKDGIYLVPVRVFIGIGWLRAFVEKALDHGWHDGTRLVAFLDRQLDAGMVVFPPYQALVTDVFLSHALVLGWIVMLGQLLAGIAIATGSLTTAALLGGIFMNLNFLLAGVPDPSAFYIVIQAALLLVGTGAVLGVDSWLGTRLGTPLVVARPRGPQAALLISPSTALALAALALGCAIYATLHIRDWTPGGSVHDPATVLAVLCFMAASWALIAALRGAQQPRPGRTALWTQSTTSTTKTNGEGDGLQQAKKGIEMEMHRFEQLVRRQHADASRRRLLGGLLGTLAAALAGESVLAAKQGRTSKRRRGRSGHSGGGAASDKVAICHVTNGGVERIRVRRRALRAHLAHGDTRFVDCCANEDCTAGPCFSAQCVAGTCSVTQLPPGTPCVFGGGGAVGNCTAEGQCLPTGGGGG